MTRVVIYESWQPSTSFKKRVRGVHPKMQTGFGPSPKVITYQMTIKQTRKRGSRLNRNDLPCHFGGCRCVNLLDLSLKHARTVPQPYLNRSTTVQPTRFPCYYKV